MPTSIHPKELCQQHELALKKRYGKEVKVDGSKELNSDNTLKWVTLNIKAKGLYTITEFLNGNDTEKVIVTYSKNDETKQLTFNRYLDAEVTIMDLIAEE